MKTIRASFFQRLFKEEQGQTAYILGFAMICVLGMGGLTVDVSHAYLVRNEIQHAANAAALAAVDGLYAGGSTSTTPSAAIVTPALLYDASAAGTVQPGGFTQLANGYNYDPTAGTVTTTVTAPCLASMLVGISSCGASNWNNQSNSVRVQETAVVPTTFMRLFYKPTLTVTAIATALPKGKTKPYNIAIILDATPSMATVDPNCDGNTEEQCALNALEGMLTDIYPCLGVSTCTADSSTNVAAVRVSLFSFPNIHTTDVTKDVNCSGTPGGAGTPAWEVYTFPKIPPAYNPVSGDPSLAGYRPLSYDGGTTYVTYQITAPSATPTTTDPDANGFSSDYYPGSTGKAMNANSTLVKIAGNTSTTGGAATKGCLVPPSTSGSGSGNGGVTYFAGAIYAAQAALQAEKFQADALIASKLPGVTSTNVIIFVSDGQANAAANKFPPYPGTVYPATATAQVISGLSAGAGGYNVAYAGTTTYSATAKNMANTANSWGIYPDSNNDCQQAMIAAKYAKSQGTEVFGIAYGSESSGCLSTSGTDGTTTASLTPAVKVSGNFDVQITATSQILPCVTIENIADSWARFFSETSSVDCSGTQMTNPVSGLASIFNQITGDLGPTPRLVPNSLQ